MTRDAGFTLLEILVALAVFGILILGLGQGVQFGLQAWNRQERTIAARSELDAVDRTLRTLVTALDPDSAVGGAAHALAFTSRLPRSAQLATAEADMAIGIDASRALVLRWTPHLHATRLAPPPPPRQALLLAGLQRLDIAYWPHDGTTWSDTWSAEDPPSLIRIRLVFPKDDPRHWADIVAAPARTRLAR